MESEGSRVLYLIEKLRSITLAVQVMPFAFCALYIVCMVLYAFASEPVVRTLDTLFYVSPATVVGMLIFSRILKLCKWHRRACILPVLPQVAVFIDYHIVGLSPVAAYIAIGIPSVMAVLLLIAAYNVFLKPKPNHNGRKERTN